MSADGDVRANRIKAPTGPSHSRSVIRLKISDDSGIRLRGAKLTLIDESRSSADLDAIDAALHEAGTLQIQRLFTQDEAGAERDQVELERRSGKPLKNLSTWLRVSLRGDDAEAVATRLRALPSVEVAYPEALPTPSPTTADYTAHQHYSRPASTGMHTAAVHRRSRQ